MRNTWQKPSNTKAPIPLQSKNGYPPQPMHRGMYQAQYAQETSPDIYPGPPLNRNHHMAPDGERGKPIVVDEERESMYAQPSPPNAVQKPAWTKATRPYPSNPPHISKYQPETDHRPSSMQEMPYDQVADPNSMHPPAPVHRTNSSQSQYSAQSSHPSNPNHNTAQAVAQTALSHPASLRPSPQRRQELTEREKMLKGNYYLPFSPALTEDREQCMAAIWRFNNATNPSHGASPQERARLFKAIMSMRPTPEPPLPGGVEPPAPTIPLPFGSVGERVVVDAPFHCDYGYNITIGDDVLIGADCRISDTCAVTIGARCIFSPNVKLVCATYPIDPRRRMGSGGQALGRNIVIEEDCWIGSNVTILAGVRVGKSSTVGAGSLLHQVSLFLRYMRLKNRELTYLRRMSLASPSWPVIRQRSAVGFMTAIRMGSSWIQTPSNKYSYITEPLSYLSSRPVCMLLEHSRSGFPSFPYIHFPTTPRTFVHLISTVVGSERRFLALFRILLSI